MEILILKEQEMTKIKMNGVVGLALIVSMMLPFELKAETSAEAKAKYLAVLKSDAPYEQKSGACRELVRVGDKECVPVLAAMLGDEKLSHMARYALEPIPGAEADAAFRAALDKLDGKLLSGVIGSIGARQDAGSVDALEKFLTNADPDVVRTTAMALGMIGTVPAGKKLKSALKDAKGDAAVRICDGMLTCAANLLAAGKAGKAKDLYDTMRGSDVPPRIKAAAIRGAILCNKSDSRELMVQLLEDEEPCLFGMALRVAIESSDKKMTKVLVAELGKLPAERVVLLVQVLGERGDQAAVVDLVPLAKKGEKTVRISAIKAITEIGDAAVLPVLVELMKDADEEVAETALTGLAGLPGTSVDEAIVKMLDDADKTVRIKMIDIAGQRRIAKAMPALLKDMSNSDARVRQAAIKSYGGLAGPAEIPVLIDLLSKATGGGEIGAYERVLNSACSLLNDKDACTKLLIEAQAKAGSSAKSALLRILSGIGGADALKAVRAAVSDADQEVHSAAIMVLCEWKTADAGPVLLDMAKSLANANDKLLSLRGYLGMAMRREIPEQVRLEMCRQAAGLIQRDDEKKMLLGALGSLKKAESLKLVIPCLDNQGTREDAMNTVLAIVEKHEQGKDLAVTREALQKVTAVGGDSAYAKKAAELLKGMEGEKE